MRNLLPMLLVLAATTLPLAAHADTIDDFVLTGGGETLTFSLPATGVYTLHLHFDSFAASGPGTINGTPGIVGGNFFVPYFEIVQGAPALTIGSNPPSNIPNLYGSIPYSWFVVPAEFPTPSDEGTFNVTFVPGTYQLTNTSPFIPPTTPLQFTLTITPETSTAPTPEPASLTLLATGAVGIISVAARRRKAGQVLN